MRSSRAASPTLKLPAAVSAVYSPSEWPATQRPSRLDVDTVLLAQHGEHRHADRHQRRLRVLGQRQLGFRTLRHQPRQVLAQRLVDLVEDPPGDRRTARPVRGPCRRPAILARETPARGDRRHAPTGVISVGYRKGLGARMAMLIVSSPLACWRRCCRCRIRRVECRADKCKLRAAVDARRRSVPAALAESSGTFLRSCDADRGGCCPLQHENHELYGFTTVAHNILCYMRRTRSSRTVNRHGCGDQRYTCRRRRQRIATQTWQSVRGA